MSEETNESGSMESEPTNAGDSPSTGQASGETEKTAAEAEQLRQENQQLQQQLQQVQSAVQQYFSQQGTQQQQAASQYNQTTNEAANVNYDDLEDEWLTSPGKASQKLAQQVQSSTMQQVQQFAQPLLQSQAATAKSVAQQDPEVREVFNKYGSEVQQYVQNVPLEHRTNPELWKKAASMVKADHFDEIVQERAQEIAASTAAQSEAGQTGEGGRSSPTMREELREKLESSTYGRKLLNKYGADGLRQHVNRVKTDLGVSSFEEYVDMVAQTDVVTDPENPSQWKNRNLMRDR